MNSGWENDNPDQNRMPDFPQIDGAVLVHAEYHFVSDIAFVIEEEEKILVMSRERIDRDFITQGLSFPGHVIEVGQRAIE